MEEEGELNMHKGPFSKVGDQGGGTEVYEVRVRTRAVEPESLKV